MKNLLAGTIAFFALVPIGAAVAADMPQPAPVYAKAPPPVAPAYSWTGFYVGANVGYGWGNTSNNFQFTDAGLTQGAQIVAISGAGAGRPSEAIGGVQAGYNWQISPQGVLGVEADWQGSGEQSNQNLIAPFRVVAFGGPATGTVATNFRDSILWFGTVRGRAGYAWDHLLFYGTGGLAYGEIKHAETVTESGMTPNGPFNLTSAFNVANVKAGWTVGAGIEGALAHNWTWKVEYLYLDLGSIAGGSAAGAFLDGAVAAQSRFTDNILRAGLNFQFH
jgi:outer membrane immunogenic protein